MRLVGNSNFQKEKNRKIKRCAVTGRFQSTAICGSLSNLTLKTLSWSIIRTTTNRSVTMPRMFNPAHPGKVLREYLDGLTVTDAASRLRITRTALSRILNGSAGISVDMALRLEAALGASAQMWLGMQTDYDLWQAEQHDRLQIEPFYAAVHA